MKRFFLFSFFTALCSVAVAQAWVHEILDASNGLPSSECTSILQDHTGHLWIGTTAGISRYDGYAFENFSETQDGDRLGKVNVIREDEDKTLWIGTDAGLFIRKTDGVLLRVARNYQGASGINDLVLTPDVLWMAAEIGPLKIPRQSVSTDTAQQSINIQEFVVGDWKHHQPVRLTHVALATDGTIYLSGIHTVFRLHRDKVVELFATTSAIDQIMALIPVDSALLYAYSSQEIFHKVVGMKAAMVDIPVKPGLSGKENTVIVLRAMGLYEFDPRSETITRVIDLIDDGILWSTQCLMDDAGIYWIASHDGLVKLKRSSFNEVPFRHPSTYPEVYSMIAAPDGDLLLGSNRGLIFQRKNEIITRVKDVNPNAEVFDIMMYKGATWYATGYEGIAMENGNVLSSLTEADGLHNNSTNTFFNTRDGSLFVTGDKGITKITAMGNSVSLKPFPYRATQTQYATFYDGIEGADGTVWVAGQEGVARVQGDSLISFPLESRYSYVASMKKDASDTVWLAVNGEGIWQCYFDDAHELKVKRKYTLQDGLSATTFTSLFIDNIGNIWICHYQGISLIRNADRVVVNFDQKDGWPFRNYNHLTLYQDGNGIIWAGCSKGLAWFDPQQISRHRSVPRIFLTAAHAENSITPSGISLPYDERLIVMQYHAIDFPEQQTIQYFYRLEGLQEQWTAAGDNREVVFDQLPPGRYVFHVKARNNKGGESDEKNIAFTVEKPFWQTSWFIVSGIVGIGMIVLLIVRLREQSIRRNEQQVKAKEIELLSLNRDLAKSRLVALRNQMNPHFIFNALNSIQQFVLQGNVDEANRYLSQFARLQRDILNSSDQDFIFLEKEIEMLKLYLELEQLRSPDSFHFDIKSGDGVDPEEIRIPPMLIQPFVENSIWHGLKHKEGEKNVTVDFSLQGENILCCVVKDNGVGRTAAELIKTQNGNVQPYASRGLQLIEMRMSMLKQQYRLPFEMYVSDVKDEQGVVSGTEVKILLPIDIS